MHSLALHEQKQHGTPEFPVEYYFVDERHPRYQMPFHWHAEWELLHILSGTFYFRIDDDEYLAKEGDVLLVGEGVLHGGTPSDCTYECLTFDLHGLFRGMESAKKDLRPFYRQTLVPYPFFPSTVRPEICSIVKEGMALFCRGECRELETIAFLCRFFASIRKEGFFLEAASEHSGQTDRIDQIKSVLHYIEAHYSEPISLEKLAAVAGMNPKYFCRVFRLVTNHSPMDYVNFYRIERAAYLLIASPLSVTEVGLECGFAETSYFTKVFRKYKALSPKEYRSANKI